MPTQTLPRSAILAAGAVTGFRAAAPDHPLAHGLAAGHVTDDTEQALLVADALIADAGRIDPRRLADDLDRWERNARARGSLDLLGSVRHRLCVVTRLRLDARLFDPVPPRRPGTIGRPRVVGRRQPTLARRLTDPTTRWEIVTVAGWYGGGDRGVEVATGTSVLHHPGLPVVPLRWVIVRDPAGAFRPQAFLCTDPDATPADILAWLVRRWSAETTFEEARRHLGVEAQRHREAIRPEGRKREGAREGSDPAIARTTPVLLGLYSLVALWAHDPTRAGRPPPQGAAWYAKER